MEVQLYADQAFPFTVDWYKTREHAPHLEQGAHRQRMDVVAALASDACDTFGFASIVDLGAGDGGMLSLLAVCGVPQWGYDLMQTNVDFARVSRGMDVRYLDFVDEPIDWADLVICTEVLEHLEDPHTLVKRIGENAQGIIASSPGAETAESHDACHAWVWDMEGYAEMITGAGFNVVEHIAVQGDYDFQVLFALKQ